MDKEKQIEEIYEQIKYGTGSYSDDARCVAEILYDIGYRKQSEVIMEFTEAVKHIANGVEFKNATEKIAFVEMLEDLVKIKGGAE